MNLYPWTWSPVFQCLLIIGFMFAAGWGFLVLIERIDCWLDRRNARKRAADFAVWETELFDQDEMGETDHA